MTLTPICRICRIIAEYNGSNVLQRRYVPGGLDQPLIWFEGTGTAASTARWLLADATGSMIAVGTTGGSNTTLAINTFDEYGVNGSSNLGRFQYKGMAFIPEAGLYHDRARAYHPGLGRFNQTDPTGYADGMNLYAWLGNDPLNGWDPTGLEDCSLGSSAYNTSACATPVDEVTVTVDKPKHPQIQPPQTVEIVSIPNLFPVVFALPLISFKPQVGHGYRTKNKICGRALTSQQRAGLLSLGAVPGHTSPVTQDGTYVAEPYGIPGGFVTTTFSPDHNRVVNVTTSFHAFVGSVTRTIYSNSSGTFVETIGVGNAGDNIIGNIRDSINQTTGPQIFNDVDRMMADYARGTFAGC